MNENGEVSLLLLNNFTGDLVEYGLLTEVKDKTYKYILGDEETTFYSNDVKYSVSEGAAYFALENGQITKIGNIPSQVTLTAISGHTGYTASSKAYAIDDNARVYIRVDGKYKVLEVKDLVGTDYSTMLGYYDKDPSYGGKIRVIVAY